MPQIIITTDPETKQVEIQTPHGVPLTELARATVCMMCRVAQLSDKGFEKSLDDLFAEAMAVKFICEEKNVIPLDYDEGQYGSDS